LLNDSLISNRGGVGVYVVGVVGLWAGLMFLYANSPALTGHPARSMMPRAMARGELSGLGESAGMLPKIAALALDALLVSICIGIRNTITVINSVDLEIYFLILWSVYHLVFWMWKGATLGEMALRLRVERLDGKRLTLGDCLIRCAAAFVSALPLGLGFWWASWDSEGRSWHDRASGTSVTQGLRRGPLL